jgi:hypothetical protein
MKGSDLIFVEQTLTRRDAEPDEAHAPSLPPASKSVLVKLDEASPLSEQLKALSKDVGLRDRELTKLAGISRATLARLRKEGEGERPEGIDDVRVIAMLLIRSGALRPQSVAGWLRSRNRGLSWHRPLEVLGEGDFSLVLSAAEAACGARVPVTKIPPEAAAKSSSFSNAS